MKSYKLPIIAAASAVGLGLFVKGLLWYGNPEQPWHAEQRNKVELSQRASPNGVELDIASRVDLAYQKGDSFEQVYQKIRAVAPEQPFLSDIVSNRYEQLVQMSRKDLALAVNDAIAKLPQKQYLP
jgi:predicted nucleic acid-binding OB-fold protein